MKTAKRYSSSAKPIDVTITVVRFRDLLAIKEPRRGGLTEYAMKLARRDPRAFIEGDDLYIKRPGAAIRFTLKARSGDRSRYYPLGISFVRERAASKTDALRLGFLNFPPAKTRAEGPSLTIVDTYRDPAKVRYKFSLFIQRGVDGAIGIIDPGIDHTGDQ